MKVLLIGAASLFGRATVDALLAHGHDVRLGWSDAEATARDWPARVEPWSLDLTKGMGVPAAADGCGAVIHLAASLAWHAHGGTGRSSDVEMDGMRRLVDAVTASAVPRFIYALAADAGPDDASGSRAAIAAEMLERTFPGRWLVLRAGLVYGPADPVVSQLLTTMRVLPAVPMLADGGQRIRPLWHEDVAAALAASVELDERAMCRRVELIGPDAVSYDELYERIAQLIDRRPMRVPVPDFLATYGARLAGALRLPFPAAPSTARAAPPTHTPGNAGHPGDATADASALSRLFGVTATPLDVGLIRLMNEQPEQLPSEGVGSIDVKQFRADIQGSPYDAGALMQLFRRNLATVMPIPVGVEPGSSQTVITPGATLTMTMPMRGHVQVRVEESTDTRVTFSTLRGHPLAGAVQFRTSDLPSGVRFEVITCDRSATPIDWLIFTLGGARGQDANWRLVVQRVVDLSEGTTDAIQMEARKLDGDAAPTIDGLLRDIIGEHRMSVRQRQATSSDVRRE